MSGPCVKVVDTDSDTDPDSDSAELQRRPEQRVRAGPRRMLPIRLPQWNRRSIQATQIRVPLRLLCLSLLLAVPVLADEVIDWTGAPSCIDRVCSLRGTVVEQEDGGPFYRLFFDAERHDVYITLMRGWMVTWPSYVGHSIVATGPVDRWRDHSEMILLTPDAIVFLDAPDTPVPDLTPIAPEPTAEPVAPTPVPVAPTAVPIVATPTASDEVEQLRDRVRTLEEKIERLEGGHPETP